MTPTNAREHRLLTALASMAAQYLETDNGLDTQNMSAGEGALDVLEHYGLVVVEPGQRFGHWTEAGTAFLMAC